MLRRVTLFCAFALVPLSGLATVSLTLSPKNCRPGDLVELRAQGDFETLARFELKLPRVDSLHLVAHQSQPVRYFEGRYRQEDLWFLQPLYSGSIRLEGIKAVIHEENGPREIDLPVQVIDVQSYVETETDPSPELLPDSTDDGVGRHSQLWLAVVGLVLVAFLGFGFLRNRSRTPVPLKKTSAPLEDLLCALRSGEGFVSLTERVLADSEIVMSNGLRRELERAVYGLGEDARDLVILLEREVSR